MKEHKVRIKVLEDGRLVIDDLPVKKGEEIEVIVRLPSREKPSRRLRGLPVQYVDPFLPVDERDWDADR
ncbi:MAG TPA: hypothetical protein VF701_02605 [Thermoanaerobaculia bacterium]